MAGNQEQNSRDLQQADSTITTLRATLLHEQNARAALDNAVKSLTERMERQNKRIIDDAAAMHSAYEAQLHQMKIRKRR